jgi:hypothetical protein
MGLLAELPVSTGDRHNLGVDELTDVIERVERNEVDAVIGKFVDNEYGDGDEIEISSKSIKEAPLTEDGVKWIAELKVYEDDSGLDKLVSFDFKRQLNAAHLRDDSFDALLKLLSMGTIGSKVMVRFTGSDLSRFEVSVSAKLVLPSDVGVTIGATLNHKDRCIKIDFFRMTIKYDHEQFTTSDIARLLNQAISFIDGQLVDGLSFSKSSRISINSVSYDTDMTNRIEIVMEDDHPMRIPFDKISTLNYSAK